VSSINSASSSTECRCASASALKPNRRKITAAVPLMTRMTGRVISVKTFKGGASHQRDAVGRLQRHRLGDQLADDDVDEGDERERQRDGHRMAGDHVPRSRQSAEQGLQVAGQDRLGHPAQGDAAQGDAELRRGDGAAEVVDGGEHTERAPDDAARDHFLDAGAPHRDQRELRRDEEAVEVIRAGIVNRPKRPQKSSKWVVSSASSSTSSLPSLGTPCDHSRSVNLANGYHWAHKQAGGMVYV